MQTKFLLMFLKSEVIIFRRKKKHPDFDLNLKICGEKLQASRYVKYVGIYLDEYRDWSPHINHLSHKLVKANAMLLIFVTMRMKLVLNKFIMLFFIPIFHVLHGVRIWTLNIA